MEHERERALHSDDDDDEEHGVTEGVVDPDAKMRDPDELAKALDEDEDGEGAGHAGGSGSGSSSGQKKQGGDVPSGLRGGEGWDDD